MVNKISCLCFIMFMAMVGCDNIHGFIQSGPKEVLNSYLEASLKNRSEEAYKYVSLEDKSAKSIDEYKDESNAEAKKYGNYFSEIVARNVSFKVLTVTETSDSAKADVEITLPDMGGMFIDLFGAAFKSEFSRADKSDIWEEMEKKYESGEIPTTTKKEDFHLVKEQEGWKIFLDWKGKKEAEEKERKIAALRYDSKQLNDSKEFAREIETLKAQIAIIDTELEVAEKDKQAYLKKVVLYDLKAKYYETLLKERLPGVEFKIKNNGNRTLKKVEVTIYFKDAQGKTIAEEDYHPVLVTQYSLSGNNKPLKPNYIWQMERGKFYKADSVPSEWKEGKVSAKITNIEFLG